MSILNQEAPAVKAEGPIAGRAGKPGLAYRFDPVPMFIADLIREGRLKPLDELVLKHLLRFRRRLRDSCWSSKGTIGAAIGRSPRTVQRSFERLGQAGVIEHRPVAIPDPDDPANGTGWRVVFRWLTPQGAHLAGGGSDFAGGETKMSPLPPSGCAGGETKLSRGGETKMSPKGTGSDGTEPDEEKTPSSSSPADDDDEILSSEPSGKDPEGDRGSPEEAIETAELCYPAFAPEIKADRERIGNQIGGNWLALMAAILVAHRDGTAVRKVMYFINTANNDYAVNGIPGSAWLHREKLREVARKKAELVQAECTRTTRQEAAAAAVAELESLGWQAVLDAGRGVPIPPTVDAERYDEDLRARLNEHAGEIREIITRRGNPSPVELRGLLERRAEWVKHQAPPPSPCPSPPATPPAPAEDEPEWLAAMDANPPG